MGKTQLVSRFLGRPFTDSYIPTIEDFHRLKYIINGHTYQLDVLDTSGQTLNPTVQNLTLLTGKRLFSARFDVSRDRIVGYLGIIIIPLEGKCVYLAS